MRPHDASDGEFLMVKFSERRRRQSNSTVVGLGESVLEVERKSNDNGEAAHSWRIKVARIHN